MCSAIYEAKLLEYDLGGVGEYWIADPMRRDGLFYRRGANGRCVLHRADEHGIYRTPLLPGLELQLPILWQTDLPGPIAIGQAVTEMVKKSASMMFRKIYEIHKDCTPKTLAKFFRRRYSYFHHRLICRD